MFRFQTLDQLVGEARLADRRRPAQHQQPVAPLDPLSTFAGIE